MNLDKSLEAKKMSFVVRRAVRSDWRVVKDFRIIGVVDSGNSFFFCFLSLLSELFFFVDLWVWVLGLSDYWVCEVDGVVVGIAGLCNGLLFDCVVDRVYRGGGVMRCIIPRLLFDVGGVVHLYCLRGLVSYYEGYGFRVVKSGVKRFKMVWREKR